MKMVLNINLSIIQLEKNLFMIIDGCCHVLLERGFVKIATNLTFDNIDDLEFCKKASSVISYITKTVHNDHYIELFCEIRGYEMIYTLLSKYRSDEEICLNTIIILTLIFKPGLGFTEDTLESFFKSGILEIIPAIIEESRNRLIIDLCTDFISYINDNSKTIYLVIFAT